MRGTRLNQWLSFGFLASCGLFFVGMLYYLVTFEQEPVDYFAQPSAEQASAQPVASGNVVLIAGESRRLEGLALLYKGLEADHILIDVTIIDLDPHYAYRHRIPASSAKKGFTVADRRFRLVSADGNRLQLVRGRG